MVISWLWQSPMEWLLITKSSSSSASISNCKNNHKLNMHVYTEMCTFVSFMKRLSILYCHNNTNKQPFFKKFIFIEQEITPIFFSIYPSKFISTNHGFIDQPWVFQVYCALAYKTLAAKTTIWKKQKITSLL